MIGSDIDGVVVDVYEIIREALFEKYGVDFPIDEHVTYSFDIPYADPKEVGLFIAKCIDDNFDSVKPIDGSFEALCDLYNFTKKPICFITARPQTIYKSTYETLKKYADFPFKLICTNNEKKWPYILGNNIKFYVDDRFKEVEEVSQYLNKCFCFNSNWNKGREFKNLYNNIIRINTLSEINQYII